MLSIKSKSRRLNKPWTTYETHTLKEAVNKHGKKWAKIYKEYPVFKLNNRTQVDLKDKYRNITRSKTPRKSRSKCLKKKYIIYGKNGCDYCKNSKDLLDKNCIKYIYVEIENDTQKEKLYKLIDDKTNNYRYFPIIFENGKFFGGYKELELKYKYF